MCICLHAFVICIKTRRNVRERRNTYTQVQTVGQKTMKMSTFLHPSLFIFKQDYPFAFLCTFDALRKITFVTDFV